MKPRTIQSALREIQAARPNAFVFAVSVTITAQDIELLYKCLQEQSAAYNQFDLMIIFNEYDGLDWGMLFNKDTANTRQNIFRKLRRYALVGGPSWLPMAIDFFRPFGVIETQWFTLEEIEKAWAFLGTHPIGEWYTPVFEEIKHILSPFTPPPSE